MARYIPPGAKSRGGGGANNVEDSQRSLGDIAKEQEGGVFTVNLRSDNTYNDLPFDKVLSDTENNDPKTQQFKFPFGYKELRKLMLWFRQIGWKDQDAVLHFPADLTKENRKQVHEIAQSFGLGTSSSGCGETRYISVYSVEKATLGVGKIYLTKEEQDKANVIWRLVKQEEDEKYKMFSHNEIIEMIRANKLDQSLQELWEKRESLLVHVEDIKEKCKVSDT